MRRLGIFALFLCASAAACSKSETPSSGGKDAGLIGRNDDTPEDPGPVDPGPVDPGPTDDSGAGTDSGGSCTGKIVINELLAASAFNKPAEEFIELYNPSTCEVGIEGFKLAYKSASGTPSQGTPLHTFAAGTAIKGKGYYVVGTSGYTGKKDVTFTAVDNTGNGFLSGNGQVALFDGTGQKVDGLGYGTLTGGDYVEKTAAPVAPASASIGRKPDGNDTDDNSKDCTYFSTPTPGAQNGP